ncbi:het domain protein [Moniliophthora roreri MCA 2997]|uniref:Het domain protein n=2 Tax=Moniliophthora roreri TaxID=221103 RepID=V2WQD8_MONRO|nr:het domain protein [Moniliophthora roreri MCA 2997]KAI3620884.1 het domain protein [Moniliophthora roreri]
MSLASDIHSQIRLSCPDFIPFTLRYLCTDVPYDYKPGGFQDFPERQGWIVYGESGKPELFKFTLLDGTDSPLKLAEKVALLQAWMFFGVIAEASSICGLEINVEDEFVSTTKEGRKVVGTSPLNGLAERWIESAASTPEGLEACCSKIRALCQFLEPRIFNLRDQENKVRLYTYDEAEVLFSIELAYRVLLLSLIRSGLYDTETIRPLHKAKFYDYQLRLHMRGWRQLQKQGWCSSEMRMLSSLNRELPYAFFAATIKRHSLDHRECGSFRCNADQINEDVYKTTHVDLECDGTCESVGMDVNALCSILSRGEIPVISVSQNLEVKVVESRSFVAISHVWSHGLGNPWKNEIPLCQLRRIRDHILMVDKTFQLGLCPEPENMCHFWLDTLCIPVSKDLKTYRKKAITLMGRTYRDASAVLVLDRELREVDTRTTTLLEQLLWFVFSGWMRRLWTLQEAALASDLFIVMKDGPQRFVRFQDGGILSANKWKRTRLAAVPEASDLEKDILLYRELELLIQRRIPLVRYLEKVNVSKEYQTPYQYLCAATERRCTSKPEDEPLILATMMGQNVVRILAEDDVEMRMAIWHQEMRLIPSEIIFLHSDIRRLTKSPYRWAPASLMENEIAAPLYRGIGVCDSKGLHVQYAGYILSEEQERTAAAIEDRWYLHDRRNDTVHKVRHCMEFVLPEKCAILFDLEYSGSGAVMEIEGEQHRGDETEYVGTIIGRLEFFKKLGMAPGKAINPGRDVIDCRRTEPTQMWCIT